MLTNLNDRRREVEIKRSAIKDSKLIAINLITIIKNEIDHNYICVCAVSFAGLSESTIGKESLWIIIKSKLYKPNLWSPAEPDLIDVVF